MSDDGKAIAILEAIKTLSMVQFPFPPGSNIDRVRAMALGSIRAVAVMALENPPRFPISDDVRAEVERDACACEIELMAKEQEINDSDFGRAARGVLLVAAERLRNKESGR